MRDSLAQLSNTETHQRDFPFFFVHAILWIVSSIFRMTIRAGRLDTRFANRRLGSEQNKQKGKMMTGRRNGQDMQNCSTKHVAARTP